LLGQAWLRKPAAPGALDATTGAGDTNAVSAADREIAQHIADARTALDAGRLQDARAAVRLALNIKSDHPDALALETRIENAIAATAVRGATQPQGAQTRPITVPGDARPAVTAPGGRAQTEPAPWPMLAALPNESPVNRRERSRVIFERFTRAEGWLREGRFADAAAEFATIPKDAPGYERAAGLSGEAQDGEGQARQAMAKAMQLEGEGDLLNAMAGYERTKQLDRSSGIFSELSGVIRNLRGLMTTKGNALFAQAELLYGKKRFKEAADQYQLVLDHLLPSDPNFDIAKSRRDAILAGRVKAPEPAE
jgi:tetratricopeptide (TPR) repeat protein